MKTESLIGIGLLLPFTLLAQPSFSFNILQPTPNAAVGNSLALQTAIQSTYELKGVSVAVDGISQSLAFSSADRTWTNTLSLAGLSHGQKVLTFTATDLYGNTGQTQTSITYRLPPTLTVNEPIAGTVARPGFPIDVTAASEGLGNTAIYVYYQTNLLASGTNTIKSTAQIPNPNGALATISIVAVDSSGQSNSVSRDLYVFTSTNWIEVCSADGPILDQNATNVLYVSNSVLMSKSRLSGTKTVLVNQAGVVPLTAAFTPSGAIFQATDNQIYEIRNGVLTNLDSGTTPFLAVQDNYALWCSSSKGSLVSYNLGTGLLTPYPNLGQASIGPNGSFACVTMPQKYVSWEVWLGRNGSATKVASSSYQFEYSDAKTDGTNVIYRKVLLGGGPQNDTIALFDGTSELVLGTNKLASSSFAVNSGWVAFSSLGNFDVTQVFTRAPAGTTEQRTFFGSDCKVVALAPNGELLSANQGHLYLVRKGELPRELGSWNYDDAGVFWKDGKWQRSLGRSLFEIYNPLLMSLSGEQTAGHKSFRIKAQAQAAAQVTLQYSTNLMDWSDLATTNLAGAGDVEFVDSTNSSTRFYRLNTK